MSWARLEKVGVSVSGDFIGVSCPRLPGGGWGVVEYSPSPGAEDFESYVVLQVLSSRREALRVARDKVLVSV